MRKVVVDREEIEAARNTLANGGGAVGVLRWAESILAQPAEADGPSFAEVLEQASVIQQLGAKNKRIDELQASLSAVTAERDRLRDQVKALQSDANGWQSGYDKGRHDGTKHRHSEVAQLRAEVERLLGAMRQIRYASNNGPVSENNAGCIRRIEQIADSAMAAKEA